ncbi:MAG: AmmeMemoRadiSam system radical SAM enzyme [Actinomycetota bacterium]|nr:AmmeMemoRadiSam system radical SAM enzyme [Actinomycetota bacterium]
MIEREGSEVWMMNEIASTPVGRPAARREDLGAPGSVVSTRYWHLRDDGRIQCDLCPRECKLHDGQRGLCYVRARVDDEIVLTTYGRSSGFCVDPIEKKPLNHFLPGTPVLSFGTAGCNLACRFCQNWDISTAREYDVLADEASPEKVARVAAELGSRSIAFTYNDPVIFHEYAIDIADAARERDIRTVAVTAGYVNPAPRREFYDHMDAANIDLKAFTEEFYHRTCAGALAPVLETLKYVQHETDVWLEITTLLIPGLNDSDEEIDEMTTWVVEHLGPDIPHHFTAFHPSHKMMDRPSTSATTLNRARRIAMDNGERYVYTGNVHDPAGQTTYCHSCSAVLIERSGYRLGRWGLDDEGCCEACGTTCAGVFEPRPGHWGSRRLPIRMADRT